MSIVGNIVLIVLGCIMFFKPEWIWKLESFLLAKNTEPSDSYLKLARFGGAFVVIYTALKNFFL